MKKNFTFSIAAMLFVAVLLIFTILKKYKESSNLAKQVTSYEVPESGVRYHTPEEVKNSRPIEEFSEFDQDISETPASEVHVYTPEELKRALPIEDIIDFNYPLQEESEQIKQKN